MEEAVTRRCSVKKVFLKNFAKFTVTHLYQSLFFNKVAGLRLGYVGLVLKFTYKKNIPLSNYLFKVKKKILVTSVIKTPEQLLLSGKLHFLH